MALFGQAPVDTSRSDSDYTYQKKNSFTSVFYGEPGDAAAWSLLIPGAGQLYNKRWWKVPLVWAGEGYLIYNLARRNETLSDWDSCWRGVLEDSGNNVCAIRHQDGDTDVASNQPFTTTSTQAFNARQDAKSARELAWVFFIAGHLIQSLEAFVDRHLINFNTSPDLGGVQFEQANQIISQNNEPWQMSLFTVSIGLNGSGH